jgi:hypothetical protein
MRGGKGMYETLPPQSGYKLIFTLQTLLILCLIAFLPKG